MGWWYFQWLGLKELGCGSVWNRNCQETSKRFITLEAKWTWFSRRLHVSSRIIPDPLLRLAIKETVVGDGSIDCESAPTAAPMSINHIFIRSIWDLGLG